MVATPEPRVAIPALNLSTYWSLTYRSEIVANPTVTSPLNVDTPCASMSPLNVAIPGSTIKDSTVILPSISIFLALII